MSFGEYSTNSGTASKGGASEYNRLCGCVSNNVQTINKNVATIQKIVDKLGTSEDKSQLQNKLQQTEQATQRLVKETHSFLKQLPHLYGDSPSDRICYIASKKIQVEKLADNFSTVLNSFQKLQRVAAEKEKESVSRARSMSAGMPTPSPMGGYNDEHGLTEHDRTGGGIQVQAEEEISNELIEERERAIRQLESDIVGVNEIFRDLATMVYEQGEVIDSIEANVDSAAVHVEDANVQLDKASNYQKAARKKMCCILVIVVVAAAALGGIIYWIAK
ncbi:Syntaxin-12 [Desmophyllum pertusum]|uniref:Syntaxin-12 n=1 Tax=Desmophyllum pertusum TaxID=174260 RepID=A0A9W9ZTW2_9CNID|nr:Syntaxin-12 [Desmophyllum pertusum]